MEIFHHKHKCEKCGMEFKTKEELDEHMKMHMQQPEQPTSAEQPAQAEQQPQQEAPVSQPEQPVQENVPEQPQESGNGESQEQPQNQDGQQ